MSLKPQGFGKTDPRHCPASQEGNDLTLNDQIAKLRLVAETAQEVWG